MSTSARLTKVWRVVLDTNVLISAYQFGGKPRALLRLAEGGAFRVLTSEPLKNELVRVLSEKFFMNQDLIAELCAPLWEVSDWVSPKIQVDLCPDTADNRVLECAFEGNANFIITGDHHLLDLPPMRRLSILKPDKFLVEFQTAEERR